MMNTSRSKRFTLFLVLTFLSALSVFAQDGTDARSVETAVSELQSNIDNAWILVSSALVLLMTIPGLALFYGGLVRQKNVLSTMLKSLITVGIVTVLWAFVGYSLVFSEGNLFIGGLDFAFLTGVGAEPNPNYSGTLPQQTFMMFQLMFAIITPALITGAFAERIKFPAKIVFTILWSFLIYYPLAHMVWGSGGLLTVGTNIIPALDFAGGAVVHLSSGVSALVCALYLGRRLDYHNVPTTPHNTVLSLIGAALLWFGWFGFNAGSALSPNAVATNAFVTTHFAAAAAMMAWVLIDWLKNGKPTAIGAISGAVAGLVGITPCAGFVTPLSALLIGAIAGAGCYFMVVEVKALAGYDDTLDVFGIHGFGGAIGAVLTGVFATTAINPMFGEGAPVGLVDGNNWQIVNQLISIGIAAGLAAVGTLVILFLVDKTIGIRVSEVEEIAGLDLTQHGEQAYVFESASVTVSYTASSEETVADEPALHATAG